MKCQNLFPGKDKIIINLFSAAESAQRVVKVTLNNSQSAIEKKNICESEVVMCSH